MAKEEKKSIIEDALTDYKQIQEAAEASAAKKLAEQFPEKFQSFLNEEIKNNKTNSEKEPYKKVDDQESKKLDESDSTNKESVMKKPKETKQVVNEERDKDFMGDVEGNTPNINTPLPEDGDTFTDKITTNQDTIANDTTIKEEIDVTGLDLPGAEGELDAAGGDDVVALADIESEISEMEQIKSELEESKDSARKTKMIHIHTVLIRFISGNY